MLLRKTKEQGSVNFLSGVDEMTRMADMADHDKTFQKKSEQQPLDDLAEEQKSKKLSHKDNGLMSANTIMSTGYEGREDEKSPGKYIKCETSNTIWGQGKVKEPLKIREDKSDTVDKTLQLEEQLAKKRKSDIDRTTSLPAIGTTAVSVDDRQNYSFRPPANGIGIFDTDAFDRVPEKTAGELSAEEAETKKKQPDDSWRNSGKMHSSKDVLNKLFEGLIGQRKQEDVQS